ncbi:MAG: T9SS type A sorting domain-containing protein [Bacteroidales bacterium]|nr:T9SS type A sorting domain-containing protein [Bacteroidales bacterium]MBN2762173.1 T9SS type A sorting domain-containing protein [Bacteroidales bacterium]
MNTVNNTLQNLFSFLLLVTTIFISSPVFSTQDDTVRVNDVATPPVIDGKGDDGCWNDATWQSIDQVWINYGEAIEANDYSGRYKIIWSSKENLLYFLVEITDDVAIGGFIDGQTADVYNYDIVEVFIDENRSGGPHIFDNAGTGENAENAFSYHIYADFPPEGEVTSTWWVGDIPMPYTNHIADFALRKTGNLYTREFSLKVYDDTYDNSNPEASRIILTKDKIMGLSLAYCDNDEDDGLRDNFFGSVWVTAENYNNHWMNADDYGVVKLYSDPFTGIFTGNQRFPSMEVYPNPASEYLYVRTNKEADRFVILDINGKVISAYTIGEEMVLCIPLAFLDNGLYYAKLIDNSNLISVGKFVKH